MRTELKILIEDSQEWVNKMIEEENQEDVIRDILNGSGIKAEVVHLKNELEGIESWCKKCKIKVANHDSGMCNKCRDEICDGCYTTRSSDNSRCCGCEIL